MLPRKHIIPEKLGEHERAKNARSIEAIPPDQLTDQEARDELVRRALAGADVYAYTPVGSERWVVRVRQPHPALESRFEPDEWAHLWHAGYQPDWHQLELESSGSSSNTGAPGGEA